jgi:hypothetical protein
MQGDKPLRLNADSRENEISRFVDSLQQLLPIMQEYKGDRLSPVLFDGVKNALDDITKRLDTMTQVLDESITESTKSKETLEYLQSLVHKYQIDDEVLAPRRWTELLGGLEKTSTSQDQLTASAENTKKTIRLLVAGVEAKRQLLLLANRAP